MNLFLKRQMECHLNGIFSKFLPRWAKDWAWFRLRNSAGISSAVLTIYSLACQVGIWRILKWESLLSPHIGSPSWDIYWEYYCNTGSWKLSWRSSETFLQCHIFYILKFWWWNGPMKVTELVLARWYLKTEVSWK